MVDLILLAPLTYSVNVSTLCFSPVLYSQVAHGHRLLFLMLMSGFFVHLFSLSPAAGMWKCPHSCFCFILFFLLYAHPQTQHTVDVLFQCLCLSAFGLHWYKSVCACMHVCAHVLSGVY